ncbi:hypothetical protein [Rhizobium leguminosarum]|uniref:Uncharacterized protein n=1 Tax=Rhizobium leguminosarum TaxID=384 RepID=A0A6P0AZY7_RHILE|nr:hypothetical protein [Rhizobium leguminosarum]MBY5435239.1 hypothetical protein [Rhizobium leguminosarum]NEI33147.1 hypothetical protein [Rhizobium leguminosarum]NEI39906.1 hypothetical protein [Rhizobium leguminosarum]
MRIVPVLFAGIGFLAAVTPPAQAALTVVHGRVVNLYADPSDFVIELDVAGTCGSKLFHIQRNRANFKEVTAVSLTAISTGKTMTLFVESCAGDRNILSHGAVNAT